MKKHDWTTCAPEVAGSAGVNFWGGVIVSRCCRADGKWAELSVTSYREQLVIVVTATGKMRVYRAGKELT